jgi:hypothetical protein
MGSTPKIRNVLKRDGFSTLSSFCFLVIGIKRKLDNYPQNPSIGRKKVNIFVYIDVIFSEIMNEVIDVS